MGWTGMAQIARTELPQHDTGIAVQSGLVDLVCTRPARRAEGRGLAALTVALRAEEPGNRSRHEAAEGCDYAADGKDVGRMGLEGIPPFEEAPGMIDRPSKQRNHRRP